MASFFAESIRAFAVGGTILLSSTIGYKYYNRDRNIPSVKFIKDGPIVGVKLVDGNTMTGSHVIHNTECLEKRMNYKKLLETKHEVYFTNKNRETDFEKDCASCKTGSMIFYDSGHSDYLAWTP